MVTTRILLFGGNGQIGKALQKLALPDDWHMRALARADCELTRASDIGKSIKDFMPDLVINAAAMTDVEACEKDRNLAQEINFHAVAHIAGQCDTIDAPLIHLSTDYVFDGNENKKPYGPDDAMNPLNVYGQTKMLGEEAVRHGLYWHVILRTSLVFGAHGNNVLTRTLQAINTQETLQAANDQIACPTSAIAVAEAVLTIAKAIMNGKGNGFGTFHICGNPPAPRFDFLKAIMEEYAPFTDRRPKLESISAKDLPARAPRPPYSALDCDKIREVYGVDSPHWRDDLAKAVKDYMQQEPHS